MTAAVRRLLTAFAIAAAALPACTAPSTDDGPEPRNDRSIVVGSFDFAESRIVAELYARSLEARGYAVQRLLSLGTRELVEPALEQDFVDVVPEYQGTALAFLGEEAERGAGAAATNRSLRRAFAARGITVLSPAPAQNRNEIVVTANAARRFGLERISDLRDVDEDMTFGGPPECPSRPLCLRGLERVYGLGFERFVPLDAGGPLTVAALRGGEVDVAVLFTTNPAMSTDEFQRLVDDEHLQPSEHLVPVVREEVTDVHGAGVETALDRVTRRLTIAALRALNRRVEVDGDSLGAVAADWLSDAGLQP